MPSGPRRCELCGSTRFLVVDHRDSDEGNDSPSNLRWLCKGCNTRLGLAAAKAHVSVQPRSGNAGSVRTSGASP
ncbi:MAG: HNH endonuclease signature motif containing protein [Terriglobia bacterium]